MPRVLVRISERRSSKTTAWRAWPRGPGTAAGSVATGTRLGPCIARPSKIICIGLNYKDHAKEAGASLLNEPIIFGKATTDIVGRGDPLVIPLGSEQTDWEVELALVIGRQSSDSFAPLGPFLATPDEQGDVHALRMWLKVNGEAMQNGTTADMIFNVPTPVSYLSQFMTLLPGAVISTGTPAGVGLGVKPRRFLKAGDVIEYRIDGLGEIRQVAKALGS
jgi:2,4-diketo-3-deoxy-L-fuconate hydrolase